MSDWKCKCGYEGDNFSPSNQNKNGKCRSCVKDSNDKRTKKQISNMNKNRADRSQKYPAPKKAVYAIIDENKKIKYVGESNRTPWRLEEHLDNHTGRTSVGPHVKEGWSYVIIADCENKTYQERMCLEKVFIYSLLPELNKEWAKSKDKE